MARIMVATRTDGTPLVPGQRVTHEGAPGRIERITRGLDGTALWAAVRMRDTRRIVRALLDDLEPEARSEQEH